MNAEPCFDGAPLLKAEGLACFRGDRRLFSALSFTLAAGEILYVEGPNGVGKSTLLRVLAGFYPAAEGKATFGGAAPGAACHYLGHRDALRGELTLHENLTFFTALLEGDLADVSPALTLSGCTSLAGARAAFLSPGQRRRASLARLLAVARPLWLLDEPLAGLDRRGQTWLADLVRTHLSRNGRVVMATHAPLPIDGARLRLSALGA